MSIFGVGPPPSLSSRRQHRTFLSLSPSCRAIAQVETRSFFAHSTLVVLDVYSMPFISVRPPSLSSVLSPST